LAGPNLGRRARERTERLRPALIPSLLTLVRSGFPDFGNAPKLRTPAAPRRAGQRD